MNENQKHNLKQMSILIIFSIIILAFMLLNNCFIDNTNTNSISTNVVYTLENIPDYTGNAYIEINNNIPNFSEDELSTTCFENYSDLDNLGRCGIVYANLGKETMPTNNEKRKDISDIIPSGWQNSSENDIDTNNIYNRCHLIAFSLSAENDNERNLITGTRYFNISGMTPFENKVRKYLQSNPENHVLYKVTPIFNGNNLVANGVNIEAKSVEDNGQDICFNVYIYNVQDGYEIDYSTGKYAVIN